MSDKLRHQAKILRGIGLGLSPSIIFVIVNWTEDDPSGFSGLAAILLWPAAASSLILLALSWGRFLAADSEEKKENQKLIEENVNTRNL